MQNFKKIEVWNKAHDFVKAIYHTTSFFSANELYGITFQIRRAVVSIPTNIAEGCGKSTDADFARYLQISFGSANEVEYLLLLSFELNYMDESNYGKLTIQIEEIKKMLARFIKKLKAEN